MHFFTPVLLVISLVACGPEVPVVAPVTAASEAAEVEQGEGPLFVLGGGLLPDSLMLRMLDEAQLNSRDFIAVLTMASEVPEQAFASIHDQLSPLGPWPVLHYNLSLRDVVEPVRLDSLRSAGLIFIAGGDQRRFMQTVSNNPIQQAILDAYEAGAMIAGTSAGAAVLSQHMITGDEQYAPAYRETYPIIWADNAVYSSGLGLISGVILDQHVVQRGRFSRLFSAVVDFPNHWAVGVDESTAVLIRGHMATVCGASQVVVVRPGSTNRQRLHTAGFRDSSVDLLLAGDTFQIPQP